MLYQTHIKKGRSSKVILSQQLPASHLILVLADNVVPASLAKTSSRYCSTAPLPWRQCKLIPCTWLDS